jgi:hypothetical protein
MDVTSNVARTQIRRESPTRERKGDAFDTTGKDGEGWEKGRKKRGLDTRVGRIY